MTARRPPTAPVGRPERNRAGRHRRLPYRHQHTGQQPARGARLICGRQFDIDRRYPGLAASRPVEPPSVAVLARAGCQVGAELGARHRPTRPTSTLRPYCDVPWARWGSERRGAPQWSGGSPPTTPAPPPSQRSSRPNADPRRCRSQSGSSGALGMLARAEAEERSTQVPSELVMAIRVAMGHGPRGGAGRASSSEVGVDPAATTKIPASTVGVRGGRRCSSPPRRSGDGSGPSYGDTGPPEPPARAATSSGRDRRADRTPGETEPALRQPADRRRARGARRHGLRGQRRQRPRTTRASASATPGGPDLGRAPLRPGRGRADDGLLLGRHLLLLLRRYYVLS